MLLPARLIDLYSFVVLVAVILSWVPVDPRNPLAMMVRSLTDPVLAAIRRVLSPMGGLDLSPMVTIGNIRVVSKLTDRPFSDAPARPAATEPADDNAVLEPTEPQPRVAAGVLGPHRRICRRRVLARLFARRDHIAARRAHHWHRRHQF